MSAFNSDFDADATFLTDSTDPNSIDALISATVSTCIAAACLPAKASGVHYVLQRAKSTFHTYDGERE